MIEQLRQVEMVAVGHVDDALVFAVLPHISGIRRVMRVEKELWIVADDLNVVMKGLALAFTERGVSYLLRRVQYTDLPANLFEDLNSHTHGAVKPD